MQVNLNDIISKDWRTRDRIFFKIDSRLYYMLKSVLHMNYPCHYMIIDEEFDKDKDYEIIAHNNLCIMKIILRHSYDCDLRGTKVEVYRKDETEPFITFDNNSCLDHKFDYISAQSRIIAEAYDKHESCKHYSVGVGNGIMIGYYYIDGSKLKFTTSPHVYKECE